MGPNEDLLQLAEFGHSLFVAVKTTLQMNLAELAIPCRSSSKQPFEFRLIKELVRTM